MEFLTDPQLLIAFFTLTALELVLGIDNVIFISILVDKLPREKRAFARRLGLFLAMFMRIALLAALSWMAGMTEPLVTVMGRGFSGRDLILLCGGLFLVWKSTQEVHQLMEGEEGEASSTVQATFGAVIVQIILIDIVFSLDSIITAIGMVNNLPVMMAAVIASVGLMMVAAGPIGEFVSRFVGGLFACMAQVEHELTGAATYYGLTPRDTRRTSDNFMTQGWFTGLVPITVPIAFADLRGTALPIASRQR